MNGQTRLPHDIGAIHFVGIGGILDAMLRIEEQHREHLMLEAGQFGAQVLLDFRR